MRRRPQISTRTDQLFPYTTLCRSDRLGESRWLTTVPNPVQLQLVMPAESDVSLTDYAPWHIIAAALNETLGRRPDAAEVAQVQADMVDRKSTRLNSSH